MITCSLLDGYQVSDAPVAYIFRETVDGSTQFHLNATNLL
jgi:hypothetical protein